MTTSLQKIKDKAVKIYRENVKYDEAELICNWSMDDLEKFILEEISLAYHQGQEEERQRIEKEVEEVSDWLFKKNKNPYMLPLQIIKKVISPKEVSR